MSIKEFFQKLKKKKNCSVFFILLCHLNKSIASKQTLPEQNRKKLLLSSDKGMGCKSKLVLKRIRSYSLNSSFLCVIPILLDFTQSKMKEVPKNLFSLYV